MWTFTWQIQNICTCRFCSGLMFRVKKIILSSILCKRNSYFGMAMGTQRQFSVYETSLWVLHLDKFSPSRILFFFKDKLLKFFWESKQHFWKIVFMDFIFDVLWWDCLVEAFCCFTLNYFLFCWLELMKAKQENSCWEKDWSQNQKYRAVLRKVFWKIKSGFTAGDLYCY